ncbi:MAG TPA: hypothetical protein ENF86_01400 [Firmicutes bacterium]|nr:hypothetical protein [Bacillota bacterium]
MYRNFPLSAADRTKAALCCLLGLWPKRLDYTYAIRQTLPQSGRESAERVSSTEADYFTGRM